MRVIALIGDARVAEKILRHLGDWHATRHSDRCQAAWVPTPTNPALSLTSPP